METCTSAVAVTVEIVVGPAAARLIEGPQNGLPQTAPTTPPTTAPGGPATTRPVPAPAAAPTMSARALGGPAATTKIAPLASAKLRITSPFPIASVAFLSRYTYSRSLNGRRTTTNAAILADPVLHCGDHAASISAMVLTPDSAMVTSSSLRMISIALGDAGLAAGAEAVDVGAADHAGSGAERDARASRPGRSGCRRRT